MLRYVAKRLLIAVGLLLALSAAIFSLQYLPPGSVVESVIGGDQKSPEQVERIRREYHLDRSLPVQYWLWLRDAVQGDLGRSYRTGETVTGAVRARLPVSAELAALGFLLASLLGIGLGILTAFKRRSLLDRTASAVGVVGGSAPAFTVGVLLIYLFTVEIPWFPSYGAGEGALDRLWHLTLPAVTLGICGFALILKLTRVGVSHSLDQDYFAFARARGVTGRRLIGRYALRGGLIPLVTGASTVFLYMLTAAVLVEVAFSIPGIASLLVSSVQYQDVPMIQGITLLIAATVILVNLAVDMSYHALDPRVRLGESR
jgi:peptide/nickel transport system permease protein